MRNDVADYAGVTNNVEVETPLAVHPGLPDILGFVVLLGAEGWMIKTLGEELDLFEESLTRFWWRFFQGRQRTRQVVDLHRERLAFLAAALFLSSDFMEAIISSAVLNGPKVRTFLRSSSDSANR